MDAGRVMLVAGGTGSVGKAVVAQALAAGWLVAQHGRTHDPAQDTAQLKSFAADVRQTGAAAALVEAVGNWHERIDAVVDCVSTGPAARIAGAFLQTQPEAYAAFLELSVVNLQRLAHAALPWLGRNGGSLIAFASDAGRFAASNQALIGAARAATIGFVRNLAIETARDGVRANCISLSYVEESASTLRLEAASVARMAKARQRAGLGLPTPADIAPLVLFLCGDGARRITGQIISVNGGLNA